MAVAGVSLVLPGKVQPHLLQTEAGEELGPLRRQPLLVDDVGDAELADPADQRGGLPVLVVLLHGGVHQVVDELCEGRFWLRQTGPAAPGKPAQGSVLETHFVE